MALSFSGDAISSEYIVKDQGYKFGCNKIKDDISMKTDGVDIFFSQMILKVGTQDFIINVSKSLSTGGDYVSDLVRLLKAETAVSAFILIAGVSVIRFLII